MTPRPFLTHTRLKETGELTQDQSMQQIPLFVSIASYDNLDVAGDGKEGELVLRDMAGAAVMAAATMMVSRAGGSGGEGRGTSRRGRSYFSMRYHG